MNFKKWSFPKISQWRKNWNWIKSGLKLIISEDSWDLFWQKITVHKNFAGGPSTAIQKFVQIWQKLKNACFHQKQKLPLVLLSSSIQLILLGPFWLIFKRLGHFLNWTQATFTFFIWNFSPIFTFHLRPTSRIRQDELREIPT